MKTVHDLLVRLENVRETSKGQWMANCPAHGGTNRKLAVKAGDPKPQVYCFSRGCSQEDIYAAVGLHWSDFYPDKPSTGFAAYDRPKFVMNREMIDAMGHRLMMCIAFMNDLLEGREVSEDDKRDVMDTLLHLRELLELA